MKKIIIYDAFDSADEAQKQNLERVKYLGDFFIFGLLTDDFLKRKGIKFKGDQSARYNNAKNLDFANEIIYVDNILNQVISDYKNYELDLVLLPSLFEKESNFLKKYVNLMFFTKEKGHLSLGGIEVSLNKKIVLTYGTFDFFHEGHKNILVNSKKYGDILIVGVSSDEFNLKKGKISLQNQEARIKKLVELPYVNRVFLEEDWSQKEGDIKKFKSDFLIFGSDWSGKFDRFNSFCNVKYLPRTEGISSTLLKEIAKNSNLIFILDNLSGLITLEPWKLFDQKIHIGIFDLEDKNRKSEFYKNFLSAGLVEKKFLILNRNVNGRLNKLFKKSKADSILVNSNFKEIVDSYLIKRFNIKFY